MRTSVGKRNHELIVENDELHDKVAEPHIRVPNKKSGRPNGRPPFTYRVLGTTGRKSDRQSDDTRCPPSTASAAPVIHEPASVANNSSAPSSSSGVPRRLIGIRFIIALP